MSRRRTTALLLATPPSDSAEGCGIAYAGTSGAGVCS